MYSKQNKKRTAASPRDMESEHHDDEYYDDSEGGGDGVKVVRSSRLGCDRSTVCLVAIVSLIVAALSVGSVLLYFHFGPMGWSPFVDNGGGARLSGASQRVPYYVISSPSLPSANPYLSSQNPLRGFLTSPDWLSNVDAEADLAAGGGENATAMVGMDTELTSTMDFYFVGLADIMDGWDSYGGFETYLEPRLRASAAKSRHVVLRFALDAPGFGRSLIPAFLIEGGLRLVPYDVYGGGRAPDYSDPNLLSALERFVEELGRRYDGDPRLGFIQAGMLGFWGEWHTYFDGAEGGGAGGGTEMGTLMDALWIPEKVKIGLIDAYDRAFRTTRIQLRTPHPHAVSEKGYKFGLHDDTFGHSTLAGEANGGKSVPWFFWPRVEEAGYSDFWKHAPMGAEIHPILQPIIFEGDDVYNPGTEHRQDFDQCVLTTHATYVINHYAFADGAKYNGQALFRAKASETIMGYAFRVSRVEAYMVDEGRRRYGGMDETLAVEETMQDVDITVTVVQDGIAPFYYPLYLTLTCNGAYYPPSGEGVEPPRKQFSLIEGGVEQIATQGESRLFTFRNVPGRESCLSTLAIGLATPMEYPDRPVRFAQGEDGLVIELFLPLPPDAEGNRASVGTMRPPATATTTNTTNATTAADDDDVNATTVTTTPAATTSSSLESDVGEFNVSSEEVGVPSQSPSLANRTNVFEEDDGN